MDKNIFFKRLHQQLAEKYSLTPHQISTIRSFSFFISLDKQDLIKVCLTKLTKPHFGLYWKKKGFTRKNTRRYSKTHYLGLIDFLHKADNEQLSDIRQKTEFDK